VNHVAEKNKDLYRGLHIDEETQLRVLNGEDLGLHPSTVTLIRSIGLVAPKGLDRPERCKCCGARIIAAPCVRCQIEGMK
jgi:hypothetical protein